jgi:hypothetical protein
MGFFDRWFDPYLSMGQIPQESVPSVTAQLRFLKIPSVISRIGNRYFLKVARSRMAQAKPIVANAWSGVD